MKFYTAEELDLMNEDQRYEALIDVVRWGWWWGIDVAKCAPRRTIQENSYGCNAAEWLAFVFPPFVRYTAEEVLGVQGNLSALLQRHLDCALNDFL